MTKEKIYVIIYIKGSNIIYIITTYILYHISVEPTLSSRYANRNPEEKELYLYLLFKRLFINIYF